MSKLSPHYGSVLQAAEPEVEPRRLELSLNPEDGSLMTAPLFRVLMAATDGLYNDLYNMAQRELDVTTAQAPVDEAAEDGVEATATSSSEPFTSTSRKEKLSNLSFAQRRHELSWRLASHGKTLTHVAALTAAAASTNLAAATKVSSNALQHARTAWVQADEAQDALYFFHAQLFPARQAPHDVYGALDVLLKQTWSDMPQDLELTVDRYESSKEKSWTSTEVADRWHMAVRDKLIRGELGWIRKQQELWDTDAVKSSLHQQLKIPWEIRLQGGIVRLTHGTPKTTVSGGTSKTTFPIEAIVTVLSTSQPAEWTLVSVDVHAQAKTGQSNHQLDTTNRQRFNLHRICALSMSREEARARLAQQTTGNEDQNDESEEDVARPLQTLFQVAHIFSLSWQLEILSAQAQALKKGIWGTGNSIISVTPVQFFENRSILGIVSISFWTVDDRYGPPSIGDLLFDDENDDGKKDDHMSTSDSVSTVSRSVNTPAANNQLTLSVRAEPQAGIRVSLSGAENVMDFAGVQPHVRSTIRELLEATSNPFALSASEALLAATRLCAERRCYAIVQVLPSTLPPWITLHVEKGSIAVSARIQYQGIAQDESVRPIVLFRMTCDARSGSFVSTFSRGFKLLRHMACNDLKAASDATALRIARMSSPKYNRVGRRSAGVMSGRAVRDAFDGLSRSMNVLGQRTGVGGTWKDEDSNSASLRHRAIQVACKDVRISLMNCCGMAAVYGLSDMAIGAATGVAPNPDMGGGNLASMNGISFLQTPPLSLLVDEKLVEVISRTADGEKSQQTHVEQNLFGVNCTVSEEVLTLCGLELTVKLESPSSLPIRTSCTLIDWRNDPVCIPNDTDEMEPSAKRARRTAGDDSSQSTNDVKEEVERFSSILSCTLALDEYW